METLRYEGSLEESVNAWPYSLVKLVDDRLCRILENNAYIAPSREERALGYCLSSEDDAAETNLLVNVDNDKVNFLPVSHLKRVLMVNVDST